jgi:UDP-galactopyranose mutase
VRDRTTDSDQRVLVIGAGPTGLGAGYRLRELGHDTWTILEANPYVGGLAASFTDDAGFTYDVGGHVLFSHYPYYDELVEKLMDGHYTELDREASVWMEGRFVPYPFQHNIHHLSKETVFDCVRGLLRARVETHEPANFGEWMRATMGDGITEHFMRPYNTKVWATPPELMSFDWMDERVAPIDVESLLRDVILGEDESSWGPNSTFRYPERGGTGALCEALRVLVDDHLELEAPVAAVDPAAKRVVTSDGRSWPYDVLLSTMPLNTLVSLLPDVPADVRAAADALVWSGSHIVGVGIDRPMASTKNWIYFPEPDVPFYRVTYLSNYSSHMTPRPDQTLVLTETSWSAHKPEDPDTIAERVIDGLVASSLIEDADRDRIASVWQYSPEMSYPVPSLERDRSLRVIQAWLQSQSIFSRGRFGAWLYEIGNMDHSTMQGVEFVDHVLLGRPETIWSLRGGSVDGQSS